MNEAFASFASITHFGAQLHGLLSLLAICTLRLYVIFMVLPATAQDAIQGRVRDGLCLCLGAYIAWGQPVGLIDRLSTGVVIAIAVKEALIGLLLGFAASTVFWVAEGVGTLIDNQAGYNNVQQTNPLSGQQCTPIGNLLSQLAIMAFYLLGGMLALTSLVFESFAWWPLTNLTPTWSGILETFARTQTSQLMAETVKVAAPVLLVLLLIDLGFGILTKTAEKLEPNSLAQPVKGAVAIALVAVLVTVFFQQAKPALSLQGLQREVARWATAASATSR